VVSVTKIAWQQPAYEALLSENYQKLVEIYEQAIEDYPDDVTNYWYLSLAYLLEKREEEAQALWLSVFSQLEEEESEASTEVLVKILDLEALRQAIELQRYDTSLGIRAYIQEFAPNSINNILHIVKLEIFLKSYDPVNLAKLQLITLIRESELEGFDHKLLSDILILAVEYIHELTIEFADVSLPLIDLSDDIITKLIHIANNIAFEKEVMLYAIDLVKLCLKYQPDNLYVADQLFWYYAYLKNFDDALVLAKMCYDKSKTNIQKAFGNHKLIYIYMLRTDWLKVIPLMQRHKQLIKTMSQEEDQLVENYLGDSLIILAQSLLYLEDNPQENRPLQNYISQLFYKSTMGTNPVIKVAPSPRNESQKLRIGYIGSTIRVHSVGWLCRWLLQHHDKENFEICLYLLHQHEDRLTEEWFKPKADLFYNFGRDTNGLIEQIQKDGINVLVDLDSMTLNLTCTVLAAKPAPIQATWLGLDASGLPTIDYFIADPYVLPENAQSYYQEKIWRLPHTYLAVDGFEVGVPNRRREDLEIPADAVIYLHMQGGLKRHPNNIHQQMRILKGVENSYLIVKGNADQKTTEDLYQKIAREEGVSPERLRFLPLDKTEEIHRANLTMADVVLDSYPYNGATTTMEVLWMGLPLVTRVGEQFAARNSYTFMLNAGITEGIATTDEEYVEWGIKYGTDRSLREQVMTKLRKSRKTSPLWNAREFTKEMEKAYQQMWAIYQENLTPLPPSP